MVHHLMLSLLHTDERQDGDVLVAAREPWSLTDPSPGQLALPRAPAVGGG